MDRLATDMNMPVTYWWTPLGRGGTLPAERKDAGVAEEPIAIVLVEDHQLVADALASTLSSQEDLVVLGVASTLAEGLALVRQQCPDVVVMDVRLPDGDGASGTAQVMEACPDTKVVVMSAETGVEIVARAVTAGAAGFVAKAAGLSELGRAIRQAHAGASAFSPRMLTRVAAHLRSGQRGFGRDLTAREREILQGLAEANTIEAMADRLVLSQHTIRNHVRNVLTKLDAHSQLEAVVIATREGLVDIAPR